MQSTLVKVNLQTLQAPVFLQLPEGFKLILYFPGPFSNSSATMNTVTVSEDSGFQMERVHTREFIFVPLVKLSNRKVHAHIILFKNVFDLSSVV